MISRFELWVRGCEINSTKIYPLEGSGDTALYKCWNEYLSGHRAYNTTPVFIGWIEGKEVCATTDYLSALACWKSARRATAHERRNDDAPGDQKAGRGQLLHKRRAE